MTRIVNTSKEVFEFQFNGQVFGPYAPGEPVDLPYEVAMHGIKRSQYLDEMGNPLGFRMALLDEAKLDPQIAKRLLVYECPMVKAGECSAKPFKSVDELRAHMESHWAADAKKADLLAQAEESTKPARK